MAGCMRGECHLVWFGGRTVRLFSLDGVVDGVWKFWRGFEVWLCLVGFTLLLSSGFGLVWSIWNLVVVAVEGRGAGKRAAAQPGSRAR